MITTDDMTFDKYLESLIKKKNDEIIDIISVFVGDVQKISIYPQFGHQTENEVPEMILNSYYYLKEIGFSKYILSKKDIKLLIEKNGFKSSDILMLDICNHGYILRLKKQRFLYHSCNKKFFAKTKIVNDGCFISNSVKYAIALELKNNDFKQLEIALNCKSNKLSSYMKTAIRTLKKYLPHIKNTLSNPYSNGFVEGNNNFIKVLKRIAFGFRSFRRFKARIMICKNLLHMKKANTF